MFDNGQIVRGTGGGICLIATGLYNAALKAGLEITERHPHRVLPNTPLPAATPASSMVLEDMKFRNTTGCALCPLGAGGRRSHRGAAFRSDPAAWKPASPRQA